MKAIEADYDCTDTWKHSLIIFNLNRKHPFDTTQVITEEKKQKVSEKKRNEMQTTEKDKQG